MIWQPAADFSLLRLRAQAYAQIRAFFAAREVLEVETPLLCSACAPELHIQPFATAYHGPGSSAHPLYLQASPELAMKRLLAAGSGPIFQLCKAFRDGESGRLHNPEFSLLEWYRPDFDHHRLMDEVDDLLEHLLGSLRAERLSYVEVFLAETGLHPLTVELGALREYAARWGAAEWDRDTCLQLILSHEIEPRLGRGCPTFIYDFPASQASLARLTADGLAARFEVYVDGVELANGFHELTDAQEQRARFLADLARRRALGWLEPPLDERFLAALAHGLPDCAGVALGVDRLLMLRAGMRDIREVLAFPLARA